MPRRFDPVRIASTIYEYSSNFHLCYCCLPVIMGKAAAGTPKAIANAIKAKGQSFLDRFKRWTDTDI